MGKSNGVWELDVNALMASEAWRWPNDLFAQYLRLLVRLVDNAGYLPNNLTLLAHYANGWGIDASSSQRNYQGNLVRFQANWTSALRHKFSLTEDRQSVFHPRIIEQLEFQKLKKPRPKHVEREKEVVISLISGEELQNLFQEAYKNYPRKRKPKTAEKAFFKAAASLARSRKCAVRESGKFIADKCREFAMSPAGQKGQYTEHMSTWLNAESYLEDPEEWQEVITGGVNGKSKTQQRSEHNNRVAEEMLAGITNPGATTDGDVEGNG